MTIASGVAKQVAYKAETTWGTAAGASGAQLLRRVASTLVLKKQTYQSSEIRTSYQRKSMNHGVRSIGGAISGEISAGTWQDFFAAVCRQAFAATSAITGASITVAGSGPTYTVVRASGSWLSDGIKVGDVVQLTAGSFDAANLNKNLVVVGVVALTLTVMPLNGVALTAEGPISSATLSVPGKKTMVPTTGHTDTSFSIEHWFSDISQSELFTGCKIDQMGVTVPPSGMSTINFDFMGKDETDDTSGYFTSPTAETSTDVVASANGLLIAAGSRVQLLTGISFNAKGNMSAEPVVGSNTYADIAEGMVDVDGQFTALFQDATLRDYFVDETEIGLTVVLAASGAAGADFVAFTMPRVKVGSADSDDGQKSIVRTFSFTALENTAGGSGTDTDASTLVIQDSQAA